MHAGDVAAGFVEVFRGEAETNGDDAQDTARRQVSSVPGQVFAGGGEAGWH